MVYILFIIGFIFLLYGANLLVDGASSLGSKFKLSPIVIGFTLVALGTSLPELLINIFASLQGETDLAITNVLGSNIMNTLFIIGAAAVIFPIVPDKKTINTLIPISLIAALMLGFLANFEFLSIEKASTINRAEGAVLIGLLLAYLFYSWRFSKSEKGLPSDIEIKEFSVFRSITLILIGVAGLYFGGKWVVDGAVFIAADFGISKALVGITIIAVATSLPELITSIIAALKKNSGIALGNALGSNIFNVFLVLGVSSLIKPLPFHEDLNLDVGVMIFTNLILFVFILTGKGRAISRIEGFVFMLIYLVYIAYLIFRHQG
jgi:cation:H+ antiporter